MRIKINKISRIVDRMRIPAVPNLVKFAFDVQFMSRPSTSGRNTVCYILAHVLVDCLGDMLMASSNFIC